MEICRHKAFANGRVWLLRTEDGYPIETTDTFLPMSTKFGASNQLQSNDLGSRSDRWMIGVSTMSGCPVRCKFCATGQLKRWRPLTMTEIVDQVLFVVDQHQQDPGNCGEFKINYTRMGEPFLNLDNVRGAISKIAEMFPNTHHYVSSIGIKNADYSWVEGGVTLQFSVHSTDEKRRDNLIPYRRKMSLEQLAAVRTKSDQKTTINMTLVGEEDFDLLTFQRIFDPDRHFVKLSPINPNTISDQNGLGSGAIQAQNIV